MIKDSLTNWETYSYISSDIKIGFNWLINSNLKDIECGRYQITDNIYANVQTYMTKNDALFEAHRKYIDIQYMVLGEELIGISNYESCTPEIPYDADNDIEFLSSNTNELYKLSEGNFVILFPQDAHKPSLKIKDNAKVKKVVVKVKI